MYETLQSRSIGDRGTTAISSVTQTLLKSVRKVTASSMMGPIGFVLLGLIVFAISILPLLYAISMAFYEENDVGLTDVRSLAAIKDVYTSREYLSCLYEALLLAVSVTTISLSLGVFMAILMARLNIWGKKVLDVLIMLPLFLSPFTGLIAWIFLASPRTGFINVILNNLLVAVGLDPVGPIVNIWAFGGVVWVMSLFFTPFAYLFTVGSFTAMNGSLEEAARASGANPLQTILKVTLPISSPAILGAGLLIFILSAEMYTIPGIIGSTANFTTLPWKIYQDLNSAPVRQAHAAASGTILLIICIIGVLIQRRATRVSARFATVGGKGHPSRSIDVGMWRWAAFAVIALYIILSVVLPLLTLLVSSFMKFSSSRLSVDLFTLTHYVTLFTLDDARSALWNTTWLAATTSLVCIVIGFIVVYADVRRPTFSTGLVMIMGTLPVAIPGLVYGLGLLWIHLRTPLYGTAWVLLLAYIAKFLPYAIVVSRSGLVQINRELEESARVAGAGKLSLFRRIVVPIMKPTLITIAFFIMILTIKELSASVLLYSPRGLVLSVLTWHYTEVGNYQFAAAVGVVQTIMMILIVVVTRKVFHVQLENSLIRK